MGEKELENVRNYDIIAVSGLDSTFRKLWVTKNYERSRYSGNVESVDIWFRSFNWKYTDAYIDWGGFV